MTADWLVSGVGNRPGPFGPKCNRLLVVVAPNESAGIEGPLGPKWHLFGALFSVNDKAGIDVNFGRLPGNEVTMDSVVDCRKYCGC